MRLSILFISLVFFTLSNAQQLKVSVKDKANGELVQDATVAVENKTGRIIFKPTTAQGLAIFDEFVVTDSIKIAAYLLGYKDYVTDFMPFKETFTVNFQREIDSLGTIVINFKRPVRIVEDTITYSAGSYAAGNEFKLKELLKKLPGLEVGRDGQVTSNGRNIEKLLIEGKQFFTGDERLGVNNIPANAVDQIQIIDNFSEVNLLKEFDDSGKLVLNVKLKEDKKRFIFGDVTISGGVTNRYVVNPALFYYSPEYAVNVIGDLNNTGKKSFTVNDYLDFNGAGYKTSIVERINLRRDSFAKFLTARDFQNAIDRFAAANYRKSTKHTDVVFFIIYNNATVRNLQTTVNTYLTQNSFIELRNNTSKTNSDFILSKVKLTHKPTQDLDLQISSSFKLTNSQNNEELRSIILQNNNDIITGNKLFNYESDTQGILTKRFNLNNLISLEAGMTFSKEDANSLWNTNRAFNSSIINLQPDSRFRIGQLTDASKVSFNSTLTHYLKYGEENSFQTAISFQSNTDFFKTDSFQVLSDQSINDFSNDLFNNDIRYVVNNAAIRLKHNHTIKNVEFTEAITYQYFNASNGLLYENRSNYILPYLRIAYRPVIGKQLSFKYSINPGVPALNQVLNRYYLSSFNVLAIGASNLNDRTLSSYELSYKGFNLLKGFFLIANLDYEVREQGPKYTNELSGIDQIGTFVPFELNEENFNMFINVSKVFGDFKVGANVMFNNGFFYQIVNNETTKNFSSTLNLGGSLTTLFEKLPELTLNYTKGYSNYKGALSKVEFVNDRIDIALDYEFATHFVFTASTDLNFYTNKSVSRVNTFNTSEASIQYNKESARWTYRLSADNLWNNTSRRSNTFSDFLISDQQIFIQPRTVLLSVSYKL